MAKRGPGSYLTHDNWDEEGDKEEAGVFKQADKQTMATRKIKTAKRRGAGETAPETSGTGGLFKGFTGFTSATGDKPAFSFGSNQAKPLGGFEAKPLGGFDTKPLGGGFSFGAKPEEKKDEKSSGLAAAASSSASSFASSTDKAANGKTSDTKNGTTKTTSSKYLSQLKALNETVSKWIKEHVDKNPYCILTPIFTDYKTHLTEIEKKYGSGESEPESANTSVNSSLSEVSSRDTSKEEKKDDKAGEELKKESPAAAGFSFGSFGSGSSSIGTSLTASSSAPTFSFGAAAKPLGGQEASKESSSSDTTTTTTTSSTSSTSLFGASTTTAPTGGFFFGKKDAAPGTSAFPTFGSTGDSGGTGGFSFATSKPATGGDEQKEGEAGEEEYVPPKPESSNIVEEDAFYTKRCKLFFKQDGDWKDRGVGNLYLKPCDDKTQLLIRADTAIGNILLNIMLYKSMPVNRHGKNNVMSMCVPNPPLDEKKPEDTTPVSMLLRVKTGEEADELMDKLKEHIPAE